MAENARLGSAEAQPDPVAVAAARLRDQTAILLVAQGELRTANPRGEPSKSRRPRQRSRRPSSWSRKTSSNRHGKAAMRQRSWRPRSRSRSPRSRSRRPRSRSRRPSGPARDPMRRVRRKAFWIEQSAGLKLRKMRTSVPFAQVLMLWGPPQRIREQRQMRLSCSGVSWLNSSSRMVIFSPGSRRWRPVVLPQKRFQGSLMVESTRPLDHSSSTDCLCQCCRSG
mmetsp:Transcript_28059/g.66731  ORF Transcript_28059/g.66731 Transcript_28059/m.66731 type:complete len:224 (-) Transcript_28059:828-1499(-)